MKATSPFCTALFGLLFLLAGCLLSGCDSASMFNCENNLLREINSPNGQYKAGVVSVKCGATTPDATWIVLAPSASQFSFENDKVATFEGTPEKIMWGKDGLIIVTGEARLFMSKSLARGVNIVYR